MTTDEIIKYLRDNKHLLNMSGMAEESGIGKAMLNNIINGNKDGRGYEIKLSKKHIPALMRVIKSLQLKRRHK